MPGHDGQRGAEFNRCRKYRDKDLMRLYIHTADFIIISTIKKDC